MIDTEDGTQTLGKQQAPMSYLFFTLSWYVVAAFVIGIGVGWATCVDAEDENS